MTERGISKAERDGATEQMIRRYVWKLYPTRAQSAELHRQREMMADLWNALKERCDATMRRHFPVGQSWDDDRKRYYDRRIRVCHAAGKPAMPSFFDLTNEITEMRQECPEWQAIPAVTAHRVAKCLIDAYAAFYRRAKAGDGRRSGYPKWRSRRLIGSIPLGTMGKTGWVLRQRKDNPLSWRLHYGSVTEIKRPETWLHARGRLPVDAIDWRNADILWRAGAWWLSVCVVMPPRRRVAGSAPIAIRMPMLGEFASINGVGTTPDGLMRTAEIQDGVDRMKAERDRRWPRRPRRGAEDFDDWQYATLDIARAAGRLVRTRHDALHRWTADIMARANDLTVTLPAMKKHTESPRGDAKEWGANVEAVSSLNRHALGLAPYMTMMMLKYKAEEAGIRCDVIIDDGPDIGVGGELVAAGKATRQLRRAIKRTA